MGKDGHRLFRRMFDIFKKRALTFLAGFVFALLCFIGLNAALEPVSKSHFCGTQCHSMETAYQSWKVSIHGANKFGFRVECIDCHLPSKDNYFVHVTKKMYDGGRSLYQHLFGGEYEVEKGQEKALAHMPNKRCLHCHDDLLAKPDSESAQEAHMESLKSPDDPDNRCIECHEEVGHQR